MRFGLSGKGLGGRSVLPVQNMNLGEYSVGVTISGTNSQDASLPKAGKNDNSLSNSICQRRNILSLTSLVEALLA